MVFVSGARAALCALLILGLLPFAEAASAPALPQPPAHLSDLARPLAYDLQLAVIPAADKFSGRVSIELDVLAPTQLLWLHAVHLEVHRASLTVGNKVLTARLAEGKDVVSFRFAQMVPPGHATLVLDYDGTFERQTDAGFFKVKEQDDWYVATNLEPDYLRRVVPSIDELPVKASWKVTLDVPINLAAFANAPETSEEPISSTMKRVHFAPTAPIASYVLAFAVGPLDAVDGGKGGRHATPVRILVPRGAAAMARYAAENTGRILALTEDYLGQPYPYDKLDVLAIPGMDHFGAMENVGLITVEANQALVAPGHETPSFEYQYAATLAHEIAHMWFGNLVTPAAWNDLWLNEGFADWMASKTLTRMNPMWHVGLLTDDERARALLSDRLLGTHALRLSSETPEAAEGSFDAITYSKGASVLRMAEQWLGEDRFRDGILQYLSSHAGGHAASEDLYTALTSTADPHVAAEVTPMVQSFVEQPGAPALDVGLICSEGNKAGVKLDLGQLRFAPRAHVLPALASSALPPPMHWVMPVCFQYGEGGDFGETCTVMHEQHVQLTLPEGERCPNWVIANTDGRSYVLPLLRDPLAARLANAPLLPDEAVPVLDDARVLVASDALGADVALSMALRFANHRQPLVELASLRLASGVPPGLIDAADARDAFAHFLLKAYGARAESLGWQAKPGEREVDDLLRVELVPLLAMRAGDAALRAEAERLAHEALAGRTELGAMLEPVLATAAIGGNQELFDAIVAAAAHAASPSRGFEYAALGHFRDPHLLTAALDLALADRLEVRDGLYILNAASEDPEQSSAVIDYVKTHFDAITRRFDRAPEFLVNASRNLCDRNQRADLEAFINDKAAKAPQIKGLFAEALETAQLCEAGRDLQTPRIRAFLSQQGL